MNSETTVAEHQEPASEPPTKRGFLPSVDWLPFVLTAVFLATLFILAPDLFLHPRFFAEEGRIYFVRLRDAGLVHALTFVFNANYQFGTNLLVWLATLVPIAYAPAVTTYLSLLVMLAVAYQFAIVTRQNNVPSLVVALALIAWASFPTNIEIFMSATNMQWVMAMSVLLLILTKLDTLGRRGTIGIGAWTAICGLTGVTSCILTPFMLARGIFLKSKQHLVLGAILTVCTLVELYVVVYAHEGGRTFLFGPRFLMVPVVLQDFVVPFLGRRIADTLGALARRDGQVAYALLLLGILIFVAAVSAFEAGSRKRRLAISIAVMWLFSTSVYLIGSIGSRNVKLGVFSAMGGPRYLDIGNFCLLLYLSLLATTRAKWIVTLVLLLFIYHAAPDTHSIQAAEAAKFPNWKKELEHCQPGQPCKIGIWPPGWSVDLKSYP